MNNIYIIAAICLIVGFALGYAIFRSVILKSKAKTLLKDAETEGENIKGKKSFRLRKNSSS